MSPRELQGEADFLDAIAAPGTVIVDCWAEWCGPCRAFAPVFERAAEQHPEVLFAKLDTDANQDVAARLAIQSIPTILAFRDGLLVFRQAGALPAPALEQLISEIAKIDSDELRRAFEAQQAPGEQAARREPEAGPADPANLG